MKEKHIIAHMKVAYIYAKLSYCKRNKVGCVIVKNNTPISIGYNGTPAGEPNECEDCNKTKSNVIHSEDNALQRLSCSHESATNAFLFVTCEPCQRCAERIVNAKIKHVYYGQNYISGSHGSGLEYLKKHNIPIEQIIIKGE